MSSFFSSDGSSTIQFAIIFLVIFLVLAVVVFAFRRLSGRGQSLSSKVGGRGRQPRLGIVDIYELDRQRQLILLRRDNVEHLLLVGGPNDVVVERNISRGVGARLGTDEAALSEAEPATVEAPRFQPAFEPAFEMPVVVAPPLPGSTARPDTVGRPLDLFGPDAADEPVTETVRVPEPRPTFDAPPKAPFPASPPPVATAASRPVRRTPPSLANLVPGVASVVPGDAKRAQVAEDAPAQDVQVVAEATSGSRTVDPGILSDMARHLEQVVRRPNPAAAALRPAMADAPPESTRPQPFRDLSAPLATTSDGAPFATSPVPAEPIVEEPTVAVPLSAESGPVDPTVPVDPMAAAMAATAEAPDRDDALFEPVVLPAPEPDRATPVSDPTAPVPVVPAPPPPGLDSTPDNSVAEASKPTAPDAKPGAPETRPVAEVAKPTAAPAKPTTPNPFSVEEIEAEFARLLGRSLDKRG